MCSDVAIKVENISKCYAIYDTPRDRLKQFILPRVQRLLGLQVKQYFKEFWALRDVSFEVRKGETIGIVGRNGSGKSTLLQIICGTLHPTNGSIKANGRISALLELGSGFNPEFTGRENVYLNGAVLGLSKNEIDTRFEDIAAFADIGSFIEQPVKTYSSGMLVRLAFSVAINVDPQILVVDEALSVGDELFQRKCLSRIEAMRSAGATILFVSHSGSAVIELCDRALLIDTGERLIMGMPKKIVSRYQRLLYAPSDKRDEVRTAIQQSDILDLTIVAEASVSDSDTPSGSDTPTDQAPHALQDSNDSMLKPTSLIEYEKRGAAIENVGICLTNGETVNHLSPGREYIVRYRVNFEEAACNVRFGMLIKSMTGVELGGWVSAAAGESSLSYVEAGAKFDVEFLFLNRLNVGIYFINVGVVGDTGQGDIHLHRILDAAAFRVFGESHGMSVGFVDFDCRSTVKILQTGFVNK